MSSLQDPRAPSGTPLYVHLPFCAAKCHYCDFFSVAAEGHDRGAMVAAILREAEQFAPRAPRTVFLGGGTPSLLEARELAVLLDGLQGICGWRESALEVTAECNPESLNRDKALALLDLGVQRLSIGFQSLEARILELFGRVHQVETSFAAFEAARSVGYQNLNVDLIYAVPGQELGVWLADLERVLALRPEHISAYNLTFEEETLFGRWLVEGRLTKQPEERELAFFEHTRARLREAGLLPYEISNFARTGLQCQHNINYWHNGPYLGLGPSAVSKVGTTRSGNAKGIEGYTRRIREEGHARAWSETPPAQARLAETWWLGLRLAEGLSQGEACQRAELPAAEADPTSAVLERLLLDGLVERVDAVRSPELTVQVGERWRLSERGLPLADHVAKRFLTARTQLAHSG